MPVTNHVDGEVLEELGSVFTLTLGSASYWLWNSLTNYLNSLKLSFIIFKVDTNIPQREARMN